MKQINKSMAKDMKMILDSQTKRDKERMKKNDGQRYG
jgi:hypothetical protein